ncbi:MAG: TfoX/Sxy family protein [Flavobacteriales bacterium]|nr:TfoX/Sxy family protein [Flavobacteriales bacterium]
MAFDEYLGERIEGVLTKRKVSFEAKKMMGGLCFMVDDKMCVGVVKDQLMARINPDIYEESLQKEGCNEMNFTGRAMKGYVFLEPTALDNEEDLEYWVDLCLEFNPLAKSSKKKKK